MTSPSIPSPSDPLAFRYWLHFVPEVGEPWFLPFDTAEEALSAIGDSGGVAGWFSVFYGVHMPLTSERFQLSLNSPTNSVITSLPPGRNMMRVEPTAQGGSLFVPAGYTASTHVDVPQPTVSNRPVEV